MLESLEIRRLMTTTLDADGVLTIRGSEADDSVTLWQPQVDVMRVEHNGGVTDVAAGAVKAIFVSVGDGNDVVILGRRGPNAKISAGAGDDTISAGDGNDTVYGDGGNDYLFGRDGNDYLHGGDGGPATTDGDDIFGGNGFDTVDYSARVNPVRIGLGVNFNDGEAGENDNVREDIEIAVGGAGDDLLENFGDATAHLYGGAGNDTIIGGAGNDTLIGGAGADVLDGAGGFDSYLAHDGQPDVIICGSGWLEMEHDPIDDLRPA
jgi:large repetitive protein